MNVDSYNEFERMKLNLEKRSDLLAEFILTAFRVKLEKGGSWSL